MYMELSTIRGSGFLSFKDKFEIRIPVFYGYPVQIEGANADELLSQSNGSGKSSLLETIAWGIYGKLCRPSKLKENVINHKSDVCHVTQEWKIDGVKWVISRYRRKTGDALEVYKDGIRQWDGGTVTDKQNKLEELFGMSFSSFLCSCMFGRDVPMFPDLSPSERHHLLNEIRHLERYDYAIALAKKQVLKHEEASKKLLTLREIQKSKLNKEQLASLEKQLNVFENSIKHQKEITRAELKEVTGRLEGVKKEQNQITASLNKELEELNTILAEKRRIAMDRKVALLDQKREIELQLSDYDKIMNELKEKRKQLEALGKKDYELNKSMILEEKELQDHTTKKKKAVSGKLCPYGYECDKVKEDAETIISTLDSSMRENLVKIKTYKDEKQRLADTIESTKARITALEFAVQEVDGLRKKQLDLVESIAEIRDDKEIEREITIRKTKLETIKSRGQVQEIEKQIVKLEEKLEELETRLNPYRELYEKASREYKKVAGLIPRIDKSLNTLYELTSYYDFWVSGYKKIQLDLFTNLLQRLEEETQFYLDSYSSNIKLFLEPYRETQKGELREEVNIVVEDAGKKIPYSMYSGGEKQKIRLALSLALARIISMDCNREFNFLCFDEPNDGLDAVGKDSNYQVFTNLANERKTVFVTDHDAYFSEKFSRNIKIKKREGCSVIEEVV